MIFRFADCYDDAHKASLRACETSNIGSEAEDHGKRSRKKPKKYDSDSSAQSDGKSFDMIKHKDMRNHWQLKTSNMVSTASMVMVLYRWVLGYWQPK